MDEFDRHYLIARLLNNFWFIPLVLMASAILLALLMLELDSQLATKDLWVLNVGDVDGDRVLLSTIAGSMITVAGVVFSIVLVAMTLTATQSGPRLLIYFMRDGSTRFVLGSFNATFVYILIVLRNIESNSLEQPHLSVTLGLLLAIFNFGILIYFIHHVAQSIQIPNIVAKVGRELNEAAQKAFPQPLRQPHHEIPLVEEVVAQLAHPHYCIVAEHASGYLRSIDVQGLVALAIQHDLVCWSTHHEGHFVVAGEPLLKVWSAHPVSEALQGKLRDCFILEVYRAPDSDLEYLINQLVEIALRAISPAINDPFTAMNCIDWLSAVLCCLAERELHSPYCHDAAGNLRVIRYAARYDSLLNDAFNQIRQWGRSSVAVSIRLLEALDKIAHRLQRPEDIAAVRRHAQMTKHSAELSPLEPSDRHEIEMRYQAVLDTLEQVRLAAAAGV